MTFSKFTFHPIPPPSIQGPVPSSLLFVLLELRQLSLVSRPLSLSELLFRHYLPPKGGDDEKVMQVVLLEQCLSKLGLL